MNNSTIGWWILIIYITFGVILAWVVLPIVTIWAINVVFGSDTIVYGFVSHVAVLVLITVIGGLFGRGKS